MQSAGIHADRPAQERSTDGTTTLSSRSGRRAPCDSRTVLLRGQGVVRPESRSRRVRKYVMHPAGP
jgi:hypothetical protein